MRAALLIAFLSAAAPAAAEPFLNLPIDCTLGRDCFIEDFVDVDPGPDARDHTCGLKARDGHKGTDFALPGMAALQAGVSVIAAAPGLVAAARDGEPDRLFVPGSELQGRECGNAVRIIHKHGYQTLYCHLENGSVLVRPGQGVAAGDSLGRVGLSGLTTFPHLHFSVLDASGRSVDPFHPDAAVTGCGATTDTLWLDPPPYEPTGFFTAGFATDMPSLDTVADGSARAASALPADALIVYAHLFHAKKGDVLDVSATGPGGTIFSRRVRIESDKANQFRAIGRRAPEDGWPAGPYSAQVMLSRGDTLLGARQAYIAVR